MVVSSAFKLYLAYVTLGSILACSLYIVETALPVTSVFIFDRLLDLGMDRILPKIGIVLIACLKGPIFERIISFCPFVYLIIW